MLPVVVICRIRTRISASGFPLLAELSTKYVEPVKVLARSCWDPFVTKYGVMGCVLSSTREGFSAFTIPEAEAGTSSPNVAKVSSASSGKKEKNAGLIPDALQLELYIELKAPAGVFISIGVLESPKTALKWSVVFVMLT